MRRALLLLLIVALLALPLALALRDLSRMLLTELLRFVWLVRQQLESIPQSTVWGLLLVITVMAGIGSLFGWSRAPLGQDANWAHVSGQVRELSRWIRHAAEGPYSRWTLNRYVSNLLWEVMAYTERTTPRRLKQRFRSGDIELPPAVADYVESSNLLRPAAPANLWALLLRLRRSEAGRRTRPEAGPRPSVEEIVTFLEEQLEGAHDRSHD